MAARLTCVAVVSRPTLSRVSRALEGGDFYAGSAQQHVTRRVKTFSKTDHAALAAGRDTSMLRLTLRPLCS